MARTYAMDAGGAHTASLPSRPRLFAGAARGRAAGIVRVEPEPIKSAFSVGCADLRLLTEPARKSRSRQLPGSTGKSGQDRIGA